MRWRRFQSDAAAAAAGPTGRWKNNLHEGHVRGAERCRAGGAATVIREGGRAAGEEDGCGVRTMRESGRKVERGWWVSLRLLLFPRKIALESVLG